MIAEFILGNIHDPKAVALALQGIEVVFHKAALIGAGREQIPLHSAKDAQGLPLSQAEIFD